MDRGALLYDFPATEFTGIFKRGEGGGGGGGGGGGSHSVTPRELTWSTRNVRS